MLPLVAALIVSWAIGPPGISAGARVLRPLSFVAAADSVRQTPSQKEPPAAAGRVPGVPSLEDLERTIFEAVNKERAARNLPPVRLSSALTVLARKQSEDMAGLGLLSRPSASGQSYTDRLKDAGVFFGATGENVARSGSFDPERIHEALMADGGNRENILRREFDEAGFGVVRGADGICYLTQDFIRSVVVRSEDEARAVVLAALDKARLSQGLSRLVAFDEVHRTAQVFAQLESEGRTFPAVPLGYGETRVRFVKGPDLDVLTASMIEQPLARYMIAGVGSRFARTSEYPGGAYWVCTFLLVGDPALLWTDQERVSVLLKTMNDVRAGRATKPLELDRGLSREADALSLRYQRGKARIDAASGRAVAVLYETSKLGQLTADILGQIADRAFQRVGISVRPAEREKGLSVNFLVVLLFER